MTKLLVAILACGLVSILTFMWLYSYENSSGREVAPSQANSAMLFGMDIYSIEEQSDLGIKPDYGTIWVGTWVEDNWAAVDKELEKASNAGVVPVIQFYYWGDDISVKCLEEGCSGKSMQGWSDIASELAGHLSDKMDGKPVVIILETEFNKNDAETYEPLDGYLRDKIRFFHRNYPSSKVVLGFGNWNPGNWKTFDRAVGESDMVGLQIIRGSTRDSLSKYNQAVDSIMAGSKKLNETFGKPILITDMALSSYPEPDYLRHQANGIEALFKNLRQLREVGVTGVIYRSLRDNPKMSTANYYKEAERHWGLAKSDGSPKPALDKWVSGVKEERSTTH